MARLLPVLPAPEVSPDSHASQVPGDPPDFRDASDGKICTYVPVTHEVRIARPAGAGRGLADWVQDRYLAHGCGQVWLDSGLLLDVLA